MLGFWSGTLEPASCRDSYFPTLTPHVHSCIFLFPLSNHLFSHQKELGNVTNVLWLKKKKNVGSNWNYVRSRKKNRHPRPLRRNVGCPWSVAPLFFPAWRDGAGAYVMGGRPLLLGHLQGGWGFPLPLPAPPFRCRPEKQRHNQKKSAQSCKVWHKVQRRRRS